IGLLSDQRFVNLSANLRYFQKKYSTILASHDEHRDMLASIRGTPYRRIERLYYDYIRAQRAEVDDMLDRLAALQDPQDGPKSNKPDAICAGSRAVDGGRRPAGGA